MSDGAGGSKLRAVAAAEDTPAPAEATGTGLTPPIARDGGSRFVSDVIVELDLYKPDLSAVNLIPAQAAKRLDAVPIGFHDDGSLMVAIADPSNVLALDDLKLMTGQEVQ